MGFIADGFLTGTLVIGVVTSFCLLEIDTSPFASVSWTLEPASNTSSIQDFFIRFLLGEGEERERERPEESRTASR